jgi:hypothetical protein
LVNLEIWFTTTMMTFPCHFKKQTMKSTKTIFLWFVHNRIWFIQLNFFVHALGFHTNTHIMFHILLSFKKIKAFAYDQPCGFFTTMSHWRHNIFLLHDFHTQIVSKHI